MKDTLPDLNQRIAERVRELRGKQRLSLDGLAARSGVSRSMISLVERGETSATAVVLDKLATGLGVPLGSLFDLPSNADRPRGPLVRRRDQETWQDPESGYVRRTISPPGVSQPVQIVEIEFPPGQRVAFESGGPDSQVHQQLWVLEGTIDVSVGKDRFRLHAGDCLAMPRASLFHNPTRKVARYVVVVASEKRLTRH
jgi:transcriptional regulator with XRE-family HTH domain